ncbi:hypothetical protein FRC18_007842 [Serendipita sp. 400]|nr:hypothetical protein FRC18_007842 [Serendipita sp. 400]
MAAASSTTPPIASSPTSTSVLDTVISSLNGTTVVFTSDNGIATTTAASAATTTATPAIDSKPAERFLIGVLLGLFTILAICFVFLIRPLVLRTWRRLRNQQAVVDQIIDGQRKVLRMRKPRLFEIWIDPRRLIAPEGLESIFRSPMEAQKWDSQKPFNVVLEYPQESLVAPAHAEYTMVQPRCNTTSIHPNLSHYKTESSSSPPPDVVLSNAASPNESLDPQRYPQIEPLDATTRICVLIAMPSPKPTYSRSPSDPSLSPSTIGDQSTISSSRNHRCVGNEDHHIPFCSSNEQERNHVVPPLAIGVSFSPLTLYD